MGSERQHAGVPSLLAPPGGAGSFSWSLYEWQWRLQKKRARPPELALHSAGARVNGEMRHGRAVAGAEAASWAAPEVVEAALRGTDAGFAIEPPATDMWSLGCLLLLLTTGSKAFSEGSLSQLRREHRQWVRAPYSLVCIRGVHTQDVSCCPCRVYRIPALQLAIAARFRCASRLFTTLSFLLSVGIGT